MTNAEAWFSIALRPRKPEGSLGRTAQDSHLDSHTASELSMEVGKKEIVIPIATLSPPYQNDSCIKMGRDESHFNVSLTDHRPQLLKRKRTDVPLLTSLTPRPNRLTKQKVNSVY